MRIVSILAVLAFGLPQPAADQRAGIRTWVQKNQQGIVRELIELGLKVFL